MPTATRAATTKLYQNLGAGMRKLLLANATTYNEDGIETADWELGAMLDKLVLAALKSAIPGRQSSKQVAALQQQARQSFARALARRVRRLSA